MESSNPNLLAENVSITGTLIWYYAICSRECWLIAHQIEANQDDDLLAQGRLNTEAHYPREAKEIELPSGVRVDKVRRENGKLILSEIKKTSKFIEAASLQLAYYLWLMEQEGVEAIGEVLVPEERERKEVLLDDMRELLMKTMKSIKELVQAPTPPKATWLHYCKTCAYNEFCWSGTDE
jgi:CRISPR-associated exonuclease Cas4